MGADTSLGSQTLWGALRAERDRRRRAYRQRWTETQRREVTVAMTRHTPGRHAKLVHLVGLRDGERVIWCGRARLSDCDTGPAAARVLTCPDCRARLDLD